MSYQVMELVDTSWKSNLITQLRHKNGQHNRFESLIESSSLFFSSASSMKTQSNSFISILDYRLLNANFNLQNENFQFNIENEKLRSLNERFQSFEADRFFNESRKSRPKKCFIFSIQYRISRDEKRKWKIKRRIDRTFKTK